MIAMTTTPRNIAEFSELVEFKRITLLTFHRVPTQNGTPEHWKLAYMERYAKHGEEGNNRNRVYVNASSYNQMWLDATGGDVEAIEHLGRTFPARFIPDNGGIDRWEVYLDNEVPAYLR